MPYPAGVADWLSRIGHNADISGYGVVADTPSEERERTLRGYGYNDEAQPGPLTDPYTSPRHSKLYRRSTRKFRISGTDAIGTPLSRWGSDCRATEPRRIPFPGERHLYGTLPVGGPGHMPPSPSLRCRMPTALFPTRRRWAPSDFRAWRMTITTGWNASVLLPGQTDSLEIIAGEDSGHALHVRRLVSIRIAFYGPRNPDPDQ